MENQSHQAQMARLCRASQGGGERLDSSAGARAQVRASFRLHTSTGCQLIQAAPCLSSTPVSQSESDPPTPNRLIGHGLVLKSLAAEPLRIGGVQMRPVTVCKPQKCSGLANEATLLPRWEGGGGGLSGFRCVVDKDNM